MAELAAAAGLKLVMLVAPTTAADRREQIAALSTGFIYYMSVAGITGERSELPADIVENVAQLRERSGKPVEVGIGIATAEHVGMVCRAADGAIVGSAIVRLIGRCVDDGLDAEATADRVGAFVEELMGPLR